MNILVVGNGGREHALAWKLATSSRVDTVFVAPGNAGTAREAQIQNLPIGADDIDRLVAFAADNAVSFTVIGPEAPLVNGVVDAFSEAGLRCLGPSRDAAQLEASKSFAKSFLKRHNIPSAEYNVFDDAQEALAWVEQNPGPCVVKADGLAGGKGVTVAETSAAAAEAIRECMLVRRFGDAGKRIVIEDYLVGEEASFICLVDGRRALPLATSQDHKARDNGDHGPNTGGMGAYSPAPVITETLHRQIMANIAQPTIEGLVHDNCVYKGFLYIGLMVGDDGVARVLEYNCRFGDPETQPILMRLKSDLAESCEAAIDGQLWQHKLQWDNRAALGVVMACEGYPGRYQTGAVISGLEQADQKDIKVFHAGTRERDGHTYTAGGRVVCVTALGDSISAAQARAYASVADINWSGAYYRTDIGYRALQRELTNSQLTGSSA